MFAICKVIVKMQRMLFARSLKCWKNLLLQEKLCLACSLYVFIALEEKLAHHFLISSWVYNKIVCTHEEAELILRIMTDFYILLKWGEKEKEKEKYYIPWPNKIYDVLTSLLNQLQPIIIRRGGLGLIDPLISDNKWCSSC